MNKRILVIAGGGKRHLEPFSKGAEIASFSDLSYETEKGNELTVGGIPLNAYDLIYIRLVGKRFEDLALLVNEAKKLKIPIVDQVFINSGFVRLPISKLLETRLLFEAGLPLPRTFFGRLGKTAQKAAEVFGYPFVIKLTTGKQGHGVWSPKNKEELTSLVSGLSPEETKGNRFLVQEFIEAPIRIRALVIGGKVVGAIQRPTRWRKRFTNEAVEKKGLREIPNEVEKLAIKATKALMLDIAGVDILKTASGAYYLLEVNSAPRWEAIKKDTSLDVEGSILKFLQNGKF